MRLTGAFERYRLAIPELRVVQMLRGQPAFSRGGPLSAWVVIWLMIFQRLDAGGTLSAAVRQLLTGGVRAFVHWPAEPLSANTSAYSQARTKLPVALIERAGLERAHPDRSTAKKSTAHSARTRRPV